METKKVPLHKRGFLHKLEWFYNCSLNLKKKRNLILKANQSCLFTKTVHTSMQCKKNPILYSQNIVILFKELQSPFSIDLKHT